MKFVTYVEVDDTQGQVYETLKLRNSYIVKVNLLWNLKYLNLFGLDFRYLACLVFMSRDFEVH